MNVDETKWKEIIDVVEAGIARYNAAAAKHGRSDKFSFEIREASPFQILRTEQRQSMEQGRWHGVARKPDGSVYPLRVRKRAFYATSPPKAWAKLANKSAAEIVRTWKLLSFIMITDVSITNVKTGTAP